MPSQMPFAWELELARREAAAAFPPKPAPGQEPCQPTSTLADYFERLGAPPEQIAELRRLQHKIAEGFAELATPRFPQVLERPRGVHRLWARLRQAWCSHAAATAHRIPGAIPPAYERRCGRCGARWSWREER